MKTEIKISIRIKVTSSLLRALLLPSSYFLLLSHPISCHPFYLLFCGYRYISLVYCCSLVEGFLSILSIFLFKKIVDISTSSSILISVFPSLFYFIVWTILRCYLQFSWAHVLRFYKEHVSTISACILFSKYLYCPKYTFPF